MKLARFTVPLIAISLLAACDQMPWSKKKEEQKVAAKKGASAIAYIQPAGAAATQPAYGNAKGTVIFTPVGNNIVIEADLTGLPAGKHGIHIHEKGDTSAPDLMSAGGHFNPDKHPHGGPTTSPVHAGDLGNIEADSSGKAHMRLTVDDISIGGKNDILGKSVIIHQKPDDFSTQPSGNSGARIAGGVIEVAK